MEKAHSRKHKRLEVFFEFLIFGIILGIAEDLIAIKFATGEPITWKIVGIVVLVTIPFAALGELIVDRVDFISFFKKLFEKNKNQ